VVLVILENEKMKRFILTIIVLKFCMLLYCSDVKTDKNDLTLSFVDALKNEEFGNLENAAYLFKLCTIYDSTCGACFYELSRILKSVGEYRDAVIYAKRAENLDKENYWYLKNTIDVLISMQNYEEASEKLKMMIKKKIAKNDDLLDYAKVLFLLNKPDEAIIVLNDIEKRNGISEMVSTVKYRYYLSIKKYSNAEKEIWKLINTEDNDNKLYGILAELSAIQRKDKLALEYYSKLLEKEPDNISGLTSLGRFYCSKRDTVNCKNTFDKIFYNKKISLEGKVDVIGDFIKNSNDSFILKIYLKNIFKEFLEIYPENEKLMASYIDFYEKIADYDNALKICKKLCILKPDLKIYREKEFYYLNILEKYQEIIQNADSVVDRFDNSPFIFLISGIAFYQNKNYIKSIDLLERGYKIKSENSFLKNQYVNYLAEAYYRIGKKDSAYYYYEIVISKDKNNLGLMNNYAYYMAESNEKLDKALDLSYYTIQREPKNATYLDTYAWIVYKKKMYKTALKYIKLAYKYNSEKSYEIIIHYGDISYCCGKKALAVEKWKESLTLGADSVKIEEKLNEFKCE
jgi:tetratricopeptide (TPR) repeat protein